MPSVKFNSDSGSLRSSSLPADPARGPGRRGSTSPSPVSPTDRDHLPPLRTGNAPSAPQGPMSPRQGASPAALVRKRGRSVDDGGRLPSLSPSGLAATSDGDHPHIAKKARRSPPGPADAETRADVLADAGTTGLETQADLAVLLDRPRKWPTPDSHAARKSIDLGRPRAPVEPRPRSNSIDPQTMFDELPAHRALLDRGWGSLQKARFKNGRRQIHPWERGVNPDLQVIPAGNPGKVNLSKVLDFEAMKNEGLLYMLAIDEQSRLRIAPETLLEGLDEDTGKKRRLGHPSLIEGAEDPDDLVGHEEAKQFRVCGEIGWDAKAGVLYAMPKSGRYSRHPDRGPDQAEHLKRRLAACGLTVDMRPVPDKD